MTRFHGAAEERAGVGTRVAEGVRSETYVRFAVRCTIDQSKAISKIAADAGMTPNELAQSAFDAMLAGLDITEKTSKKPWIESVSDGMVDKVYSAICTGADVSGYLTFRAADLCRDIGVDGNSFYASVRRLQATGKVERVQNGGFGRSSILKILKRR